MLSSCGLNSGSADPEANSENKNTIEETDENITGELSEKSALWEEWGWKDEGTEKVNLDLTKSYPYLDSVALENREDTLGDILAAQPNTIIYFYPADFTPNCTVQALDFSEMKEAFEALGYQIIGVSKNDISSHRKFAEAKSLTIKLLEDREGTLLAEAGALGEPKEYGNGPDDLSDIIRTTIVVDSQGNAKHAFYDVEATGHAKRVYDLLKSEQEAAE